MDRLSQWLQALKAASHNRPDLAASDAYPCFGHLGDVEAYTPDLNKLLTWLGSATT